MGTQAILSIVHEGKVTTKVVAGCDGGNMWVLRDTVADYLGATGRKEVAKSRLFAWAHQVGLTCDQCLVIQTAPTQIWNSDGANVWGEFTCIERERWRDKFNDPAFNPRWDAGTAAFSFVIDTAVVCRDVWKNSPGHDGA